MENNLLSNIITQSKAFGLTLQEGAEATQSSVYTTSNQPTTGMDNSYSMILSIGIIAIPIIMAVAFCECVKGEIQKRKEFSGIGWGLANGILGIGVIWIMFAHNSVSKEIGKIKDKKYKTYAIHQMNNFAKTYCTCIAIWIVILVIMFISSFNK